MFNSILEKGYFIQYSAVPDSIDNPVNSFCGPHRVNGADCPNCNKKLLRLFSFDAHGFPVNQLSFPFNTMDLFYCWTCNVSQDDFFYRYLGADEVEIVKFQPGGVETDFPYENYPEFFPAGHARFVEIDKDVRLAISKTNLDKMYKYELSDQIQELLVPQHQFGGEPYLVQPDKIVSCPECGQEMPFLAAIGDNCLDERGFAGNEFVQTIFKCCQNCLMLCAYQQVD